MLALKYLFLGTSVTSLGYYCWIGGFKKSHLQEVDFEETEAFYKPYQGPYSKELGIEFKRINADVKKFNEEQKESNFKCKSLSLTSAYFTI